MPVNQGKDVSHRKEQLTDLSGLTLLYNFLATTGVGVGQAYLAAFTGTSVAMRLSTTDAQGKDVSAILTGLATGSTLRLAKMGDPSKYFFIQIATIATPGDGYLAFTFDVKTASGAFATGDLMGLSIGVLSPAAGIAGPQGLPGGPTTLGIFNTVGSAVNGFIHPDNATLASVVAIDVKKLDANGVDVSSFLSSLVAGDRLRLFHLSTPTIFGIYQFNSLTDHTSYVTLGVTAISGHGTFTTSDALGLTMSKKGDTGGKGDKGDTGDAGGKGDKGDKGDAGDAASDVPPDEVTITDSGATVLSVIDVFLYLLDINNNAGAQEGDVLTWNSMTGWAPVAPTPVAPPDEVTITDDGDTLLRIIKTPLSTLDSDDASGADQGDVLMWNGSNWIPTDTVTDSGAGESMNFNNRTASNSAGNVVINWATQYLRDANGMAISIDWNSRLACDSGGNTMIDWASGYLVNGMGAVDVVNWFTQQTKDTLAVVSMDWGGRYLYDGSGTQIVVNWGAELLNASGVTSVDWGARVLHASDTSYSVDWNGRILNDAANQLAVSWASRYLQDATSVTALDWGARIGYDSSSESSFDFQARYLNDTAGTGSAAWGARELFDASGVICVDWAGRTMLDQFGAGFTSISWNDRIAYGANGAGDPSINWATRKLIDSFNVTALDWEGYSLYDSNAIKAADWTNRILKHNSAGTPVTVIDWQAMAAYDHTATASIDWDGRFMLDSANKESVGWDARQLRDSVGPDVSVDWESHELVLGAAVTLNWSAMQLYPTDGSISLDWTSRTLNDSLGMATVSWGARLLTGGGAENSLDWGSRYLIDNMAHVTVDWQNLLLMGPGLIQCLTWGSSGGAQLGFFGAAAATQPIAVPDVPTAGSANASDNADAINAILSRLRTLGLFAT